MKKKHSARLAASEPNSKLTKLDSHTSRADRNRDAAESTSRQDLADSGSKFWPPDLIFALAEGKTIAQASKISGVSERSIYRYQQKRKFRDQIARVRQHIVDQAIGRLAAEMTNSVHRLAMIREYGDADQVRLAAARYMLEMGLKVNERAQKNMEQDKLEQRVRVLEAKLDDGGEVEDVPTRNARLDPWIQMQKRSPSWQREVDKLKDN